MFSQKPDSSRVPFEAEKKNLRLKSKALLIPRGPRRTGPSSILVFKPSTSHVFTALDHSPMPPGKPPSLNHLRGWFGDSPRSSRGTPSPGDLQSSGHLCPFLCSISKPRVPQAPWGERDPASSQEAPSHPRCCRRARRVGSSPPCLCRRLGHAERPRETANVDQSQATKWVVWRIPSFAELLPDAFLEPSFRASPKEGHGKSTGSEDDAGQLCWLHAVVPICSRRFVLGVTINCCQSTLET